MNQYILKHKNTGQEVNCKADTQDAALQIYCSECDFSIKLKEQPGWWDRNDVEINEVQNGR